MHSVKITCISENTIFNYSLLSSIGQSFLIEIDKTKYLFDTTEIYEGFSYNLKNLGIKLDDIENVIISHNHLDHSGALFKLIDDFKEQKLFLPPDMLMIKEDLYNTNYRTVNKEQAIRKLLDYKNTVIVNEGMEFEDNVFTTGPLPAGVKEQSIAINVPNKGLVLIVGCSHPTLPVIVEKARQVTGANKIYVIIGGLHYIFATEEENAKHVDYIKSLNLEFIVPSHCSGYKAIRAMQENLGEKVKVSVTGQFGSGNSVTILPDLNFNLS